jgi:F420-non-reducing hydrogenase iron-sulfur subunit
MPGDCHYLEGNLNARRRVEHGRALLQQVGLEPERLRMVNMSSAMAGRFAEVATEISEEIARLGPNPLSDSAGRCSDRAGE